MTKTLCFYRGFFYIWIKLFDTTKIYTSLAGQTVYPAFVPPMESRIGRRFGSASLPCDGSTKYADE
jgi:hypothetical protein